MRIHWIGLATGLLVTAATATQASTPVGSGAGVVAMPASAVGVFDAKAADDGIVIARRGRGGDDPAGDDHGGRNGKGKGKGKAGKGRGGNDDGPNHDLNDDDGVHGPNHS
jgi:hypothetical protein